MFVLPLFVPAPAQAQAANSRRCDGPFSCAGPASPPLPSLSKASAGPLAADTHDKHEETSTPANAVVALLSKARRADGNREFFHKNKLEFSLETGYLPQNIPFPFDFLLGSGYNMTPSKYTLMPVLASLRWQMGNIAGPWIFRGNWEASFTALVTPIPRGPETHYIGYAMGIRRNLVQPNWRATPFANSAPAWAAKTQKNQKG